MNPSQRFLSLDVFRGMTVCFMIIVITPGSGAQPFAMLEHAAWHGFTPTDLVFPSFLFAVGNAMSFSMKKFSTMSNPELLAKIFKRALLIFLIGFLIYWFPFVQSDGAGGISLKPLSHTRILGVLQRIALCYAIASLLIHYLSTRTVAIISVLFLVGYWLVLLFFGDVADPFSMTGNVGHHIDMFLFGEAHLYHGEGIPFDPEGLLSTIPSCVNVIIGYYAGKFIQEKGKGYESISKLLLAGLVLVLLAISWNTWFPINKKLWTSSFVLLTCGLDLLIIGALIYVIEVKTWQKWTGFFTIFGKNPLFIYIVADLLLVLVQALFPDADIVTRINTGFFQVIAPGPVGSLLFALCFMLVCWCVGYVLDRRKIYIRV